ncbi:hypothetical protein BDN71DRAFT_1513113 [Pleurotus eryngii]|uniref:Uncharacterized protein n=1 Tax=Pleurotus eryngii TaxID=5323 RepID=A0A9P6D146_PLEER|nr:hypothetical protein BDN71DRAFT_1513113 [Pleurotus eryngii]
MSPNESHWQPHSITDPSWKPYTRSGTYRTVWEDWWNQKGKGDELLLAGRDVDLESLANTDLADTQGKFYIREHHVQLYERLCKMAQRFSCGGVVLFGQPGTGKTYYLFFLLLKKLTKGEPVLFSLSKRPARPGTSEITKPSRSNLGSYQQ